MPYRPYPDRWRTLSHLRRQQSLYRSGWLLRPVAYLTGAREQLFARVLATPNLQAARHPGASSRRIAKMDDRQVEAALARSDAEIEAARSEVERYAPAIGSPSLTLWYH